MKKNDFIRSLTIILFIVYGSNLMAVTNIHDIGLSSITITTPGSYTIQGTANQNGMGIRISNSSTNAVYNITLNNMTLIPGEWSSALVIENDATTKATVYLNILGNNVVKGGNHGGIKVCDGDGDVDIIFTTTGTNATFESSGVSCNAFQFETTGKITTSIDANIVCSATLDGVSTPTETALSEATSKKPLILTLSSAQIPTDDEALLTEATLLYPCPTSTSTTLHVANFKTPIEAILYNPEGKQIRTFEITQAQQSLSLDGIAAGIYFLKVEGKALKLVIR